MKQLQESRIVKCATNTSTEPVSQSKNLAKLKKCKRKGPRRNWGQAGDATQNSLQKNTTTIPPPLPPPFRLLPGKCKKEVSEVSVPRYFSCLASAFPNHKILTVFHHPGSSRASPPRPPSHWASTDNQDS